MPEIRPSPDHLLSSLSYQAQADLISQVPDLRIVALMLAGGLLVARHVRKEDRRRWRRVAATVAAVALFFQMATDGAPAAGPGVATAGTVGNALTLPTTPREELVEVRQRATIDGFDTVTLAARDPNALEAWLAKNGYSVPGGLADVAAAGGDEAGGGRHPLTPPSLPGRMLPAGREVSGQRPCVVDLLLAATRRLS